MDSHPASELSSQSANTRGWISEKTLRFPISVVLGFGLIDALPSADLEQLHILIHEHLITSKIEIFAGRSNQDGTVEEEKLGYTKPDAKSGTSYDSRELRAVQIVSKDVRYLRLLLHRPHPNEHNPHSQVGIIALNVVGSFVPLKFDLAPLKYDSPKRNLRAKLISLETEKAAAVAREDYDLAKMIKKEIDNLTGTLPPVLTTTINEPISSPAPSNSSSHDSIVVSPASTRNSLANSTFRSSQFLPNPVELDSKHRDELEEDEDEDYSNKEGKFVCPFCLLYDEETLATQEQLDFHLLRACPLLCSCSRCGTVVEVASLNEHLLKECEYKTDHRGCSRCGEAISLKYYQQHVNRGTCVRKSTQKIRCPLCHSDQPQSDQAWREHHTSFCLKNTRLAAE